VARLVAVGEIELRDEPDPVAGAGESLVRVSAVGICGSDLHWFDQGGIGDARLSQPLVLGHEMAGVALDGPLAGQRVAIDPAIACAHCRPCHDGYPNLCPNVRFAGHGSTDGGLRELMAWPSNRLHPLPDRIGAAEGALLEPLGVAIHALDLAHLHPGDRVAVIGCGPIGLLALQLTQRITGGAVLAVDPLPHRRDAALRFGARAAVAPADAVSAGREIVGEEGFDVTVEIAGTDAAVAIAIELARPGARVVLAGIPDDDRTSFSASGARRKGLTLLLVRRMGEVYPRAIEASAVLDLTALVSDRYPLVYSAVAFATAGRRDGLKVVIEP
jgi:L-iditol 2-dehydrogenase